MYVKEVGSLLKCLESMDRALDAGRPEVVKEQIKIIRNFLLNALDNS